MKVDLAKALLDALDDETLDELARRLGSRLPNDVGHSSPLDVNRAAARCGVSSRTIRRAVETGALEGSKIAGRWRIEAGNLARWAAAGGPTSCAPGGDAQLTRTAPRRRPAPGTGSAVDAILGGP